MASPRNVIIGTAGHIDHGKSSLVQALTGVDPDRLPEEKSRGMTIDLGFAHITLGDGENAISAGLIDVPGHTDFIRNMVAGVGSLDLALFIVAADDSWMPQSEEHLQILTYLGIENAVIALTKADLSDDIDFVTEDLRTHLIDTPFEEAPVVPVSSKTGEGISGLRDILTQKIRGIEPTPDLEKPRLHIDRVFSPTGIGTVVTGTLEGGALHRGDEVVVQPHGSTAKIRTLQNHNSKVDTSLPGMRTAVNIPDAEILDRSHRDGVHRGATVTLKRLGDPVRAVDIWLSKSSREIAGQPNSLRPLKNGQRVRCHAGTADIPARLFLPTTSRFGPGDSSSAQLRFFEDAFLFAGDHLVLRDWGKSATIAGGLVLDAQPVARNFRKKKQQVLLEQRAASPADARAFIESAVARDFAIRPGVSLTKSLFSKEALDAATRESMEAGVLHEHAGYLVDAGWWDKIIKKASSTIQSFHAKQPEAPCIPLIKLRGALVSQLPERRLLDVLIDGLIAGGSYEAFPGGIRATGHFPKLTPDLTPLCENILVDLKKNPVQPPNPKQLAPGDKEIKVIRFLIGQGEVTDLEGQCYILTSAFETLKEQVGQRLSQGPATVSELREVTGTTRRILVPLLEYLDRHRFTIRDGELRHLATAPATPAVKP